MEYDRELSYITAQLGSMNGEQDPKLRQPHRSRWTLWGFAAATSLPGMISEGTGQRQITALLPSPPALPQGESL